MVYKKLTQKGRHVKVLIFLEDIRLELENGYKNGKRSYSQRCHIILLKNKKYTTEEIAEIVGVSCVTVSTWVQRFEKQGLTGLKTKSGQGRLKHVKNELEESLNKKFSIKTLKCFLKKVSANGNVYA